MEDFEIKMAQIFEVETLHLDDKLESFECWDSLTLLSIIAMADEIYHVELSADDVKMSLTIRGLQKLIISRMS